MPEKENLMAKLSNSEQRKEDWMNSKWRPTMGWMYMAVCLTDFILFPILWSIIQAVAEGQVSLQWQPITLQGAGLFHVAMGAVLGVAAYGRTQEKLVGANIQYYSEEESNTTNFQNERRHSLRRRSSDYHAAPITRGYGGRKAPVPEPEEEL